MKTTTSTTGQATLPFFFAIAVAVAALTGCGAAPDGSPSPIAAETETTLADQTDDSNATDVGIRPEAHVERHFARAPGLTEPQPQPQPTPGAVPDGQTHPGRRRNLE